MKANYENMSDREALREQLKRFDTVIELLSVRQKPVTIDLGLITNAQVQNTFGISDKTVREWCKDGILRPIKIHGRIYFKLSDIQDMLNDHLNRK